MTIRQFDTQLLEVIQCPVTGEPLSLVSDGVANSINSSIGKRTLRDCEGRLVKDRTDGLLVNSSSSIAYFIRQGVPLLQHHLAIEVGSGLKDGSPMMSPQSRGKMMGEIDFWHSLGFKEDYSHQSRYQNILKGCFNLDGDFFTGKRVIDIGCGPMGSLNSLTSAKLRVGLDPLSEGYLQFLGDSTLMSYVCGVAENVPAKDGSFDAVISLNSLDHVDDLEPVVKEITRITSVGGHFILFTEIHREPTNCEPIPMDWDICKKFSGFREVYRIESEKEPNMRILPFDHSNHEERYGFLFSILQRLT